MTLITSAKGGANQKLMEKIGKMISGVGSFGGGYGVYDVRTRTYIPPSPDELNEFDLHRAYICPACGHPTMEHEFAGGSMSMVLSCCHEDMIRVPTYFTGRYVDSVMIERTERQRCECQIQDMFTEFDTFCERHKEYQQEARRRHLLRICGTDL